MRDPTDAVLSLVVREPRISVRQALKHHVSFYGKIVGYHHHAYVVGPFEEVIRDYGAVLERVNARFGTRFSPFDRSEDNVNEVFARMEKMHRARRGDVLDEKQISRPSTVKAGLKEAMRKELKAPKPEVPIEGAGAVHGTLAAFRYDRSGSDRRLSRRRRGAVCAKRPGLPPAVKLSWAGLATPARVGYNPLLVGIRRRGN
jgi:hypothetical protein